MRRNLLLVATQETTVTKTLILLFHPDLRRSKANAALAGAAAKLDGVEFVDMQAAYPDSMDMFRDGEREARRLLAADRIVLQFPIQWYSTPPLMKAWQDAVLTRMFYVTYETEGRALEGTPLMLAATAGNVPESYPPAGATCSRWRHYSLLYALPRTAAGSAVPRRSSSTRPTNSRRKSWRRRPPTMPPLSRTGSRPHW